MSISNYLRFGLILLLIILIVILGILTEVIRIPMEAINVTTTTITTSTTTLLTTTIPQTTTTIITTTTIPIITKQSYCKDNRCWLYESQSVHVEEENVTYTITLTGVMNNDTAVIDINGETKSFHKGEDRILKGLGIYMIEIFYFPKKEQVSFVELLYY